MYHEYKFISRSKYDLKNNIGASNPFNATRSYSPAARNSLQSSESCMKNWLSFYLLLFMSGYKTSLSPRN